VVFVLLGRQGDPGPRIDERYRQRRFLGAP
jgi:hypothetical protein